MKKLLSFLSFLLISLSFFAQTIVGTTVETKNVVLEEFTGIHCTFCPQGHAIAQAIKDAHPDNVFLINIHTGSYATPSGDEPDFRTDFGAAIASQSGLTGYPAGTVNRHLFSGYSQGSGTAMSRDKWELAANQILPQDAYVNIAVEAELNIQTREIIVHVEAYYTGDSPEATNMLNVALLQDNTLGPQVGGNMGDNYVHMHRLVHMITGQWGEEITTTTTGTFVDRTYTYSIPDYYNNVEAIITNMKIVAFITETTQEVANGNGCIPTFTGLDIDNDANVKEVFIDNSVCGNFAAPMVNIENLGQNDITSLTFEYNINNYQTATYDWTGSISTFQSEVITLPEVEFLPIGDNIINVSIADDDYNDNNINTGTFEEAPFAANDVNLILNTDGYGFECSWNLTDIDGNILYSGGSYGNNQTINETFELTPGNCYIFNLMDSDGDGGAPVYLTDSEGTIIFTTYGDYGSGVSASFASIDASVSPSVSFSIPTTNAPIDEPIYAIFNQPVRQINDELITDPSAFITFTSSAKTAVAYTAQMMSNNRVIEITPDQNLAENTSHQIQITPGSIESFYDLPVSFIVFNFTTGNAAGVNTIANNFTIYPNPTSNLLNITNTLDAKVEIYNIVGSLVYSSSNNLSITTIDVSSFNTGTYIIKITNGTNISTSKFNVVK